MHRVFIQTDTEGRITAINSDAFLPTTEGWTQIDQGEGDRYHHAQGNYLPQGLMTEEGVYRYKLVDGQVQERTAEEIQADVDALPPLPSYQDIEQGVLLTVRTLARTDAIKPQEALQHQALFPLWQERLGSIAELHEYLRYEDGLFRVQQEHTIQEHQPPSVHTAALYTRVQPEGTVEAWQSGQSYAKDVEVTHKGGVWLSMVDNNTWEPGAAGVYDNIWKRVRDA